mmetsp:Transcript_61797/g.93333  ORF Transcript_61797/g.93333 Transcript_61797/m.93333 type:complete len:117 (-) Transcript_61797:45-395(-)
MIRWKRRKLFHIFHFQVHTRRKACLKKLSQTHTTASFDSDSLAKLRFQKRHEDIRKVIVHLQLKHVKDQGVVILLLGLVSLCLLFQYFFSSVTLLGSDQYTRHGGMHDDGLQSCVV